MLSRYARTKCCGPRLRAKNSRERLTASEKNSGPRITLSDALRGRKDLVGQRGVLHDESRGAAIRLGAGVVQAGCYDRTQPTMLWIELTPKLPSCPVD